MGQCTSASSSHKMSFKKMMRNTLKQFVEKTDYLVDSYEALIDTFEQIKLELFQILTPVKDPLFLQKCLCSTDLKARVSMNQVPQILEILNLDFQQEEDLEKVSHKLKECLKCVKALKASCCKALQKQEIGWSNYQIIQSSTVEIPAQSQSKSKPDNVYELKRDTCAQQLITIIQNIDDLSQACDFDSLNAAIKKKLILNHSQFLQMDLEEQEQKTTDLQDTTGENRQNDLPSQSIKKSDLKAFSSRQII